LHIYKIDYAFDMNAIKSQIFDGGINSEN
jgi:hypothetical protein